MKYFVLFCLFPLFTIGQDLEDFKKPIAFIYAKDSLGNPVPNGTCFIIGKKIPNDSLYVKPYFVTAKHVLLNKDSSLMKEIYIKMNTKDANSRFIVMNIDTSGPLKTTFFHEDKSVDLALLIYSPKKTDYEYKYIPESFLFDRIEFNNLKIGEGTEAFFTGLFVPFIGERKIYPIYRFGKVALIPDEKIMWINEKREIHLIEISSFGGNSGAPVFYKILQPDGRERIILGGVLSGTYRDFANIIVLPTNATPFALYNNGISGITPVYFLKELLNSIN
jgi:hypothetical protein